MKLPQISNATNTLLKEKGFTSMNSDLNGKHFTTQLIDKKDDIGDLRISWAKVPVQDITVIAQQIENDQG